MSGIARPLRVVRRAAVLSLAVIILVQLSAPPAAAFHNFVYWQQSRDAGSCCVEVRAHSQTTPHVATSVWATITHGGHEYIASCVYCVAVASAYNYPATVKTGHAFKNSNWDWSTKSLSLYYP